jgi:hypothetical protein
MLSHDTLSNYYTLNFSLMQFHEYSLTELDSMIPWEREIYVGMLVQHIRHETEMAQLRAHQARN